MKLNQKRPCVRRIAIKRQLRRLIQETCGPEILEWLAQYIRTADLHQLRAMRRNLS